MTLDHATTPTGWYSEARISEQAARAAALTVCAAAIDVEDARRLLGALGLPGGRVDRPSALACGHPATALRRHPSGRGHECGDCRRAHKRARYRATKATRGTA